MLVTVAVLALLTRATVSFNCSIRPIYVDFHVRPVHGSNDLEYGTFIGFGTPSQNESLAVSLNHNETSIADVDFCKQSTLFNCSSSSGGTFVPAESSSWKERNDYASLDADSEDNDDGFFGEDTVHMYTHFFETDPATETKVDGVPIRVSTNSSSKPGRLGLGQDSTLLTKLFSQGLVASRSYSLFVGSGSRRAGGAINGSLTLGGYDASRLTGPVHNYSVASGGASPFRVRVVDVQLNNADGSNQNVSLLRSGSSNLAGFDADISAGQYPLSLPFEVTENFRNALDTKDSDSPDGSLALTSTFAGSMTITLEDGFSVTLPSDVMYNASGLSPVAARAEDDDSPFVLSTAWLSQVYMMVDYDARAFHLAQAVPESKFISMRTTCPKTVPKPYEGESPPTFTRVGLTGVITASVVGGLGFIALTIWLGLLFLRWRVGRREKQASSKGKGKDFVSDVKEASKSREDDPEMATPPQTPPRKKRLGLF
ncbi:MAG: hypothetical protein M1833_001831 [Piccolia ochrophora]|nr:MAG: hypothetical protein M1833_001831 [Piccolia ochrophora]